MPSRVTIKHRGGRKLDRLLRTAMKGSVKQVSAGFFSSDHYDDEKKTPVAAVAAWNEFGTETIPERPFFRTALEEAKPKVVALLKDEIDPRRMTVGPLLADKIGERVADEIRGSIDRWREPPNAPATIARKGRDDPLVDTGQMRDAATWRVKR